MNKVSGTLVISFFILKIFLGGSVSAQEKNFLNKFDTSKHAVTTTQIIFNRIESAIAQGNVNLLSSYLDSQTYLSLSNGIRGYYSSNQTYYVLEDFFRIYKVASFHFNNLNANENVPYAIGVYSYEFKGKRNTAQAYISLKKTGNSLKITQITIN